MNLNLKTVFTSGDSMTVLQLLDKLIKQFQGEDPLYVHDVQLSSDEGVHVYHCRVISPDKDSWNIPIAEFLDDTVTELGVEE